jgi:hypothetical protein
MKKELIDSVAATVNTGGAMELTDVVIYPSDPAKDLIVKIALSVFVGLVSPIVNEIIRGIKFRREKRLERKNYKSNLKKEL